jgi:hypothetical protein
MGMAGVWAKRPVVHANKAQTAINLKVFMKFQIKMGETSRHKYALEIINQMELPAQASFVTVCQSTA